MSTGVPFWSEALDVDREGLRAGLGVEAAEPMDQPGLVHGPELIENDLAALALERAGNALWPRWRELRTL